MNDDDALSVVPFGLKSNMVLLRQNECYLCSLARDGHVLNSFAFASEFLQGPGFVPQ